MLAYMHKYPLYPHISSLKGPLGSFHFYNDCPIILKERKTLSNALQHPGIVVKFNTTALFPLQDADPYLLAFLAFPFPSLSTFFKY